MSQLLTFKEPAPLSRIMHRFAITMISRILHESKAAGHCRELGGTPSTIPSIQTWLHKAAVVVCGAFDFYQLRRGFAGFCSRKHCDHIGFLRYPFSQMSGSGNSQMLLLAAGAVGATAAMTFYALNKRKTTIANMPVVKGGYPFFGQVFEMISGSPWDIMTQWVKEYGTCYQFWLFGSNAVAIADPELLKIILQTKMAIFKKDLVKRDA